jgi:hypothetical protein
MKTFAVLLALLALARMGHAGQTNELDLKGGPSNAVPTQLSGVANASGLSQTNAAWRAERRYSGVLPDLRRKKGQTFKPAPGRPPGFENVSIDPLTGRADGIIVFSIGF